ncbi:MAG: MFS transporter [Halobacteriota archaeon]
MTAEEPKISRRVLGFTFAVTLLDFVGLTIFLTIQAFIVRQYNDSAIAVSLLTALYAAAQFISAPLLGQLSDRYGRRPLLLISLFGSFVGYLLFGIGGALWVLYLSRLIDGFTGGNVSIATAIVSDLSPYKDRTRNLGILGAAFGLGFVIGPLLGSVFSQISLAAPAYVAAIIALAATSVGFFILPESLPKEKRATTRLSWKDVNPFKPISKMLRRHVVGLILIVFSIFSLAFNGFVVNEAVFLLNKFGIQAFQLGFVLLAGGLVLIVVQGGIVGRLSSRFGDKRVLMAGLLIEATGFVLFSLTPSFETIYLISGIIAMGAGLIFPTVSALLSKNVPMYETGEIFGVSTSLASLMNVLGPLWVGVVYDRIAPSAPYWTGALFLAIGFVLMIPLKSATSDEQARQRGQDSA